MIALKKVIDLKLTNVKLIRVNANEMLSIFDTKEIDIPDFNIVSIPTLCFAKMTTNQHQHQIIQNSYH